ncbi:hypothetical protein EOL01_27880, partial [Citrobacter freundii]
MINTYRTKSDLLTLAQEVAALLSCASYLATIRGDEERLHVMSLTGLARLNLVEIRDIQLIC